MGIVGIINVTGLNYLVVINKAEVVGQLLQVNINKVSEVKLLPFKVSGFDIFTGRKSREQYHLDVRCYKTDAWRWILF